jgi:quercetin dioxygenase-like cupin family protein
MVQAARLGDGGHFRVHLATLRPRGVVGRHPASLWQLFHVVSGSGWVSGSDGRRVTVSAGQSVLWEPGETHGAGFEAGMVVLLVAASLPLPRGEPSDPTRPAVE